MFRTKFHRLSKPKQKAIIQGMYDAGINHDGQSHADFAENNTTFRLHCENAGVECTRRQAAKYRKRKGSAYVWGRK